MLNILQFELLGYAGSATFGSPFNIERSENLQSITGKWVDLFSSATSPILSQAGDFGNRESSPPIDFATQPVFATQVPETTALFQLAVDKGVISRPPGNEIGLLQLLSKYPGQRPSNQIMNPAPMAVNDDTAKLDEIANIARKSSVLSPVSDDRLAEISSRLDTKANIQHSQSSIISQESTRKVVQSRAVDSFVPQAPGPGGNGKENNHEDLGIEKAMPRVLTVPAKPPAENKGHREFMCSIGQALNINHFEGLKRVPRASVRLSETQQKLLERDDSWVQTELDSRSIYTVIPSDVLQDLRAYMDRRWTRSLDKTERGQKLTTQAASNSEVEEDREDSDEDIKKSYTADGPHGRLTEVDEPGSLRSRPLVSSSYQDPEIAEASKYIDDGDDMSEQVSWPPSPERDVDLSSSPPISTTYLETGIDKGYKNDDMDTFLDTSTSRTTSHSIISYPSLNNVKKSTRSQSSYAEFPSSSSAGEEELDLDFPHAIGDSVEDTEVDLAESINTSQGFPSTVAPKQSAVQVVQTPSPILQDERHTTDRIPLLKRLFSPFKGRKRTCEDMSSDPVIPATFNDSSSQLLSSNLNRLDGTDKDSEQNGGTDPAALECKEPENDPMNDATSLLDVAGDDDKRNDFAEQQLIDELICSQQSNEDPLLREGDEPGNANHFVPASEKGSSPVEVLSTNTRPSTTRGSSQAHLPFSVQSLKRSIGEDLAHDQRPWIKRSKHVKSLHIPMSQGETGPRETEKLAKASRHLNREQTAVANAMEQHEQQIHDQPEFESSDSVNDRDSPRPSHTAEAFARGSGVASLHLNTPMGSPSAERDALSLQEHPQPFDTKKTTQPLASTTTVRRNNLHSAIEPSPQLSAYDDFKLAYPSYPGSKEEFVNSITYLEWLGGDGERKKNFLRKSLWDDLIRSNAMEFKEYVVRELKLGKDRNDLMKCLDYFNGRDEEPVFKKQVITPDTLQKALSSLDPADVAKARKRFREKKTQDEGKKTSSVASVPSVQEQRRDFRSIPTEQFYIDQDDQAMDLQAGNLIKRKETVLRTPFFETQSQARGGSQGQRLTGYEDMIVDTGIAPKPKTPRNLPWSRTATPQNDGALKLVSNPSTPSNQKRVNSGHSTNSYQAQGSPILGSNYTPSRPLAKAISRSTSGASLPGNHHAFGTPKLPTSTKIVRRTTSMLETSMKDLKSVEEWPADQDTEETFNERIDDFVNSRIDVFVKRKSGSSSSNATKKRTSSCSK